MIWANRTNAPRRAWARRTPQTQYGGSGWAWQRMRTAVLQRDGYVCHWCRGKATTADHVLARAFGGADAMDNLVACCVRCNETRRKKQAIAGRRATRPRAVTRW